MKFSKILFLCLFSFTLVFATNYEQLTQKFNQAKIDYLRAVVNGNSNDEVSNLKIIIETGKQISIDTKRYEDALNSIYAKQKQIVSTPPPQTQKTTLEESPNIQQQANLTNLTNPKPKTTPIDPKFSINAVENNGNDIIIRFNHDITLDDISFSQERGRGTHRDIFDIKGNFKDAQSTVIKIDGIDRVIVNQQAPSVLRVSIVNSYDPNTIYIVNQRTIVLRTFPKTPQTPKETAISSSPAIQKTEFLRARTIVIDPGHGGKDPGAVIGNNHEKTAVLAVGRYLAEHLRTRGYKVLLTRDNDKYLTLKERTEFANHNHADIFISIHANAVDKQNAANARGVETYFLSPARSERAKRLAALENKDEMQSLDLSSQNALLTILNQSRITSSNKLAIDIQKYMLHEARKSHKDTVDGGVREGPFYVLVGAQMPSVLVEIGYITHPIEGKRIFETNYQKQLAKGIANGIDSYFLNNP